MRVLKNEAGLQERVLPIECHAIEENHALWINEHLHVLEFKDMVARAWFGGELELVAETRTAAAEHSQAQTTIHFFTRKGCPNFIDRFRRYIDLLGRAFDRGIPRLNFWRTRELS